MDIQAAKNMALTYMENGQLDEARQLYEQICYSNPNDSDASYQLANVLRLQGRYKNAIDMFHKTLEMDPGHIDASIMLAHAYRGIGDLTTAVRLFDKALRLKRGTPLNEQGGHTHSLEPPAHYMHSESFCTTRTHKLKHDSEQIRYLVSQGLIPKSYEDAAHEYDRVRSEIVNANDSPSVIHLDENQRRRIRTTYNMFLYNAHAPAISPNHAVNPECDMKAIEGAYHDNPPGVTYFDDFLTEEALDKLTRFCLESTIWYKFNYPGYIGTSVEEGFSCGLLFQIEKELREALPSVFLEHKLLYCWAFKYDSVHEGIKLHADNAAINVNFWITPDEANLDPETGGLIVYSDEAPLDWDAAKYNRDPVRIRKFLDECNSDSVRIPYRQNRVVIFHSNLFHETDRLHFKEGYQNRRINITMLFGRRGG